MRGRLVSLCGEWKQGHRGSGRRDAWGALMVRRRGESGRKKGGKREEKGRMRTLIKDR